MLVPLPMVAPVGKDASVPFPCQDRPCGCATAEQCWKSCCCFTNVEKVAWARRTGATIPDYVVDAAKKELDQPATVAVSTKPPCSHCKTDGKMTDRASRGGRSATTSCCDSGNCHHDDTDSSLSFRFGDWIQAAAAVIADSSKVLPFIDYDGPATVEDDTDSSVPASTERRVRYVHGWSVQKCHGLSSIWEILSVTMVSNRVPSPTGAAECLHRLVVTDDDLPICFGTAPDPPPRMPSVV